MTPHDLAVPTSLYLRARKSLVAFRKLFLGTLDDVPSAPFHHRWSEALLYGKKHIAFEAFRESAKTEIAVRTNLLHALTFPVARRSYILVICATKGIAAARLEGVSREFLASEMLSAGVCDVPNNSGDALEVRYENGQKVRIATRGRRSALRGANWNGRRPDLVLCDDLQDAGSMHSELLPDKDWRWFLDEVLYLGKKSRIFLIGNNLGEACIMERVIANRADVNFETHVIPVISELSPQGVPAWPGWTTAEEILAERDRFARMGHLDIWYRNKMCRCVSPGGQKFKKETFRYYDGIENPSELAVYTTVDPAVSKKPGADFSAIVTVGVDREGHWFVLDVDRARYDPSQTIDAIFEAVRQWRPLCVGVETVAYQSALQHFLQKEMPRRNQFFTIIPLKAERKKELRIDALQPRFAVGSVWLRSGAPWLELVERELLAYPYGQHDDIIDALAYVGQLDTARGFALSGGDTVSAALFDEERRFF